MFDSERKVEVTPRPGRGRVDDRFRQIRVGKGAVSVEFEPENLLIPALAADVLRASAARCNQRSEKRQCGRGAEPDSPRRLHSFSARVAGG
jgi:hypothetical protein